MSEKSVLDTVPHYLDVAGCITESESFTEHQDALDATLFRPDRDANELVFELEAGKLRVRKTR